MLVIAHVDLLTHLNVDEIFEIEKMTENEQKFVIVKTIDVIVLTGVLEVEEEGSEHRTNRARVRVWI